MVSFLGFGSPDSSSSSIETSRSSSPSTPQTSKALANPRNPDGIKPCCACPETKTARDECFFKSSPEEAGDKCREYVEAHRACMANFGFKV